MTEQVRAELAAAGRLDSSLGALALTLAERVDVSAGVAGVAPLVRELRDVLASAMAGQRVSVGVQWRAAR